MGAGSGHLCPRHRGEALDLVPEEDVDDLQRMCPRIDEEKIGRTQAISLDQGTRAEILGEAQLLLGARARFLDGYIHETQMAMEAEAKARLAQESGGQYL